MDKKGNVAKIFSCFFSFYPFISGFVPQSLSCIVEKILCPSSLLVLEVRVEKNDWNRVPNLFSCGIIKYSRQCEQPEKHTDQNIFRGLAWGELLLLLGFLQFYFFFLLKAEGNDMNSSQETVQYYNASLGDTLCQYCSDSPERLILPWHCPG